MGKVIQWELCKKLKFNRTKKWYMHNQESFLENETPKLLWDFAIRSDPLISAKRLDLVIISMKNRTCRIVDFTVSADHCVKLRESKNKDKNLDPTRELKKLWNMNVTVIPVAIGTLGRVTGGIRNKRMTGDHSNYSIIENEQNTEESLGDLRRLAVTQTPVRNSLLTWCKNSKRRI